MSRRPSSWSKLSTTVERPGQPVALMASQAWYQLRARKRATFAKKNRDTFADTSRATLSCTAREVQVKSSSEGGREPSRVDAEVDAEPKQPARSNVLSASMAAA